jgi:hypothetical protein
VVALQLDGAKPRFRSHRDEPFYRGLQKQTSPALRRARASHVDRTLAVLLTALPGLSALAARLLAALLLVRLTLLALISSGQTAVPTDFVIVPLLGRSDPVGPVDRTVDPSGPGSCHYPLAFPILIAPPAHKLCRYGDLRQVLGWKSSLNAMPWQAKEFCMVIMAFTVIAPAELRWSQSDEGTCLVGDRPEHSTRPVLLLSCR